MAKVSGLRINGTERRVDVDEGRTLLGVLRDVLDLTGAKYGCGEGQCGACTVLVDGRATRSCLATVGEVAGAEITTIEGLASGTDPSGPLHPVQQAFLDHEALQCGYCTPGMILAGVSLLNRTPHPDDREIARAMEGNVCRCGTYPRIVAAIRQVAGAGSKPKGGDR